MVISDVTASIVLVNVVVCVVGKGVEGSCGNGGSGVELVGKEKVKVWVTSALFEASDRCC